MKIIISLFALYILSLPTHAQRITKYERQLIKSGKTTDKMHVTLTTNNDDYEILRRQSLEIPKTQKKIWTTLSKRMLVTVQHPDHKGVGIAAPQVGINRRLFLIQRFDKEGKPFEIIVNPEIIAFSDSLHARIEGCLSIPILRDTVTRPWMIEVKYQNIQGKVIREKLEGFTARIFQHEIDHLDGVLFTDRL
ncbi:MAG: peptide deformylase [Bacteroidales bacterium]|nr:peptide deformylase [Bacteroidales bacterium]